MNKASLRLVDPDRRSAPRKFRFTKQSIEQHKPTGSRVWLYDTGRQGLALLVAPKGGRSFYYVRSVGGKSQRQQLGLYPSLTIEQARKLVAQKDGDHADGRDPFEKRRTERADAELTFACLFGHWLEHHAKLNKRRWAEDEQKFRLHLKPLHGRKANAISRSDVQNIITKIGTAPDPKPIQANRVLSLVSAIFNMCIDDLELKITNPAARVRKFPERSRERFMNADELTRFYVALVAEPQVYQDVFELLLLTAARSGNVTRMQWSQLDLSEAIWIVPAAEAKANRQIIVPLAGRACEILQRRLAEAADPSSPWVFPSHRRDGKHPHLLDLKVPWRRVCTAAELDDLHVHDLRHSCASWMGKTGSTLQIIGKVLGHARPATTQVYVQSELEQVRHAVDKAAEAMLEQKWVSHGKA